MKKIIIVFVMLLGASYETLADTPPAPAPTPRVSIFSTSTDWQAITGLLLNERAGFVLFGRVPMLRSGRWCSGMDGTKQ